ncbi:hypothetical protein [Tautonia plasticadhaerens]|uniref:Uncharacterized protein n=1 Tax=Tautonia plasticadhaerens TaxID=2527974 RepID=A0A518H9S6_9BACT|nr:hypothetical protein [Tautonia plasticadhaerens]QDV37600.1 hypothetical protein ElP_55400 [Tautonia plasticadhaerens]
MSSRRAQKDARKRPHTKNIPSLSPIPYPADQAQIAEAAHRAVCEVTGTDGFGKCLAYAVAGYALLGDAGYMIQAGTLTIVADPSNPAGAGLIRMDASNGGFDRGEYHAWLARQVGHRVEVVDLAARHYRRYVNEVNPVSDAITLPGGGALWVIDRTEDRIRWTRPGEPPTFVWTEDGHAEGLAYFMPDVEACLSAWSVVARDPMFHHLRESARRHMAALTPDSLHVA